MINYRESTLGFIIVIILGTLGIILLGMYLRLIMRGGGIVGVFLALLAGGILVYWMKEVTSQFKGNEKSSSTEKWDIDVIEDKRDITIVTKIPSPCEKVAIFLKGRVLHVTDEGNLKLDIPLKRDVKLLGSTYKNKVLQVKLEKIVKKSES